MQEFKPAKRRGKKRKVKRVNFKFFRSFQVLISFSTSSENSFFCRFNSHIQ